MPSRPPSSSPFLVTTYPADIAPLRDSQSPCDVTTLTYPTMTPFSFIITTPTPYLPQYGSDTRRTLPTLAMTSFSFIHSATTLTYPNTTRNTRPPPLTYPNTTSLDPKHPPRTPLALETPIKTNMT